MLTGTGQVFQARIEGPNLSYGKTRSIPLNSGLVQLQLAMLQTRTVAVNEID
jgi:hypothetical protein